MVIEAVPARRREVAWMEVRPLRLNLNMIELGWSNAALAEAVGCTRQYISVLRQGKKRRTCTPEMATKIAAAMGLPLSELFIPRSTAATRMPVMRLGRSPQKRASRSSSVGGR